MTDDELDFGARKYSHRFLWVGLLDSGNLAIADSERRLLETCEVPPDLDEYTATFIFKEIFNLLRAAYDRPFPEPPPPPEPEVSVDLSTLSDLDLQI